MFVTPPQLPPLQANPATLSARRATFPLSTPLGFRCLAHANPSLPSTLHHPPASFDLVFNALRKSLACMHTVKGRLIIRLRLLSPCNSVQPTSNVMPSLVSMPFFPRESRAPPSLLARRPRFTPNTCPYLFPSIVAICLQKTPIKDSLRTGFHYYAHLFHHTSRSCQDRCNMLG
jgi:hypothetical protein